MSIVGSHAASRSPVSASRSISRAGLVRRIAFTQTALRSLIQPSNVSASARSGTAGAVAVP